MSKFDCSRYGTHECKLLLLFRRGKAFLIIYGARILLGFSLPFEMNQTPNLNLTCMKFSTCSLRYQRENCGQVPRYFKREYKIPDNLFCNTILGQLLTSAHVKLNLRVLCVLKGQLKNIVCE